MTKEEAIAIINICSQRNFTRMILDMYNIKGVQSGNVVAYKEKSEDGKREFVVFESNAHGILLMQAIDRYQHPKEFADAIQIRIIGGQNNECK